MISSIQSALPEFLILSTEICTVQINDEVLRESYVLFCKSSSFLSNVKFLHTWYWYSENSMN